MGDGKFLVVDKKRGRVQEKTRFSTNDLKQDMYCEWSTFVEDVGLTIKLCMAILFFRNMSFVSINKDRKEVNDFLSRGNAKHEEKTIIPVVSKYSLDLKTFICLIVSGWRFPDYKLNRDIMWWYNNKGMSSIECLSHGFQVKVHNYFGNWQIQLKLRKSPSNTHPVSKTKGKQRKRVDWCTAVTASIL